METQQPDSSLPTVVSVAIAVAVGIGLSRVLERELGVIPGFLLACSVAAVTAVVGGWLVGKVLGR